MAITRLALSTPTANTDTFLYAATRNAIVSVIATNKDSVAATIRAWAVPSGATLESQYAFLAYDTVVPSANAIETFRFAVQNGDNLYVRSSSANVSFSLNGIYEETGKQNISVKATAPSNPQLGDVWVNNSTQVVSFWDGTLWQNVNNVAGQSGNTGKLLTTNGSSTSWTTSIGYNLLPDTTNPSVPTSRGLHNAVISTASPVANTNDGGTQNGDLWFVYIP